MARNPDANSMPKDALSAPQAVSPSQPAGSVGIVYDGLDLLFCFADFAATKRWPINPTFYAGCGFRVPNYSNHNGVDLFAHTSLITVTNRCGPDGIEANAGGDWSSGIGTPVYAALGGCKHQGTAYKAKVIFAGNGGSDAGNCVVLEHLDETHRIQLRTRYLHLNSIQAGIVAGAFVTAGQQIGTLGATGLTAVGGNAAAHLHFELHSRPSDHPDWRTSAEQALMPATCLQTAAVDPETGFFPPLPSEDEDLISVAEAPPPAQSPPLIGQDARHWHPFAKWPLDPAYSAAIYGTVDGSAGGWPAWTADAYRTIDGSADVYPFLDSPTGRIWVAGVQNNGPTEKEVWLLHTDQNYDRIVITWYLLHGASATVSVTQGDWIDAGTKLGTFTKSGIGLALLEWGVFCWDAPYTTLPNFTLNPEEVYYENSVHPACFLFAESTAWTNWPPAAYRALSSPCLGFGLGGV